MFIKGFSRIAHPVTYLQGKNAKLKLSERCYIFLTSAPILKIADLMKYFVVCTDACIEGQGGILMQEENVICYELHKLKEHENNYVMHDLEL